MPFYFFKKSKGAYRYTVITVLTNFEKSLDEYFHSLVNQSLDFAKNIDVILVDIGPENLLQQSINKWKKRYSTNISYFYKKNCDISNARNFALSKVKTDWVTFINANDFIDFDYFRQVDKNITKDISICLCNPFYFFDIDSNFYNTHPLKYCFGKTKTKQIKYISDYSYSSVSSIIFNYSTICENNILFNEVSDAESSSCKFVYDYLKINLDKKALYLKRAKYFYRQKNQTSAVLWHKGLDIKFIYSDYISILEDAELTNNGLLVCVKNAVLINLHDQLVKIITGVFKLDKNEIDNYLNKLKSVFSHIDEDSVLRPHFNISQLHKIGILGLKNSLSDENVAYINNIDIEKKQILIVYYTKSKRLFDFSLNDQDLIPNYIKTINYNIGSYLYAFEKRCWISYQDESDLLTLKDKESNIKLNLLGKSYRELSIFNILKHHMRGAKKYKSDGSWIIMDRDVQADDNGEHFYRYMRQFHPEQKCYFALNKDSHDWVRLQQDNFQLLDFGSLKFEHQLRRSSKIISSYFDEYIQDYFGDNYCYSKKFIFLQHGITKDDISESLNNKKNMLRMITATSQEYDSIIKEGSPYQMGKKEVALTGFPRHDVLLQNSENNDENLILIMPTWRLSIVGNPLTGSNKRNFNHDFLKTKFAQCWGEVLRSKKLEKLAIKYKYKIIFAPHINIEPYIPILNIPDYIDIWTSSDSTYSIQDLFKKATFMITDYSSVAFEMAFLKKLVVYYQFDRDTAFSGSHIYRQGYFSYEKDGFGPICLDKDALLNELEKIMIDNGQLFEPYAARIENMFPYRDGKNCQRVYDSIVNLDSSNNEYDVTILNQYINQALEDGDFQLYNIRNQLLK